MKRAYLWGILMLLIYRGVSASPVRIIGMGMIDLILEDESNRINLYDFGGNVAGLYADERGSSVEGFLSYGNVSYSDSGGSLEPEITRWGGFLPTKAAVSVNTFTTFGGLPAGGVFTYRSPEGYAAVAKTMYSSTSAYHESTDRTDDATAPLFGCAFTRHFGLYDLGAEGEYTSIRITNNQDDTEIHASMKTLGVGFAAQLSPLFAFGLNGGWGFPAGELTVSNTDDNFSGTSFSGALQGIARIPGLAKIGAKLDFINANLEGEVTTGNITRDLGDLRYKDLGFETRILFASMLFPLRAGAMVGYETFHPEFEGEEMSLVDIDVEMNTVNVGIGLGYVLPFITPGFQYTLINRTYSDNINDDEVDTGSWNLGFGVESKLAFVTLRGGWCLGREDPDRGTEDDEMRSRSLSVGGTFSMPLKPYKFEFAYVTTETKPEEHPEDLREVDNSLSLSLKFHF